MHTFQIQYGYSHYSGEQHAQFAKAAKNLGIPQAAFYAFEQDATINAARRRTGWKKSFNFVQACAFLGITQRQVYSTAEETAIAMVSL